MEVVATPFRDHDVREWSRIDGVTGALERARLETDRWSARTGNSSRNYDKVVDCRARSDADGAVRRLAARQLEVFNHRTPGGRYQVIRTQSQTATSTKWTSMDFENLQLPVNALDVTSQKSKASAVRSVARRPPTRRRHDAEEERDKSNTIDSMRVIDTLHGIGGSDGIDSEIDDKLISNNNEDLIDNDKMIRNGDKSDNKIYSMAKRIDKLDRLGRINGRSDKMDNMNGIDKIKGEEEEEEEEGEEDAIKRKSGSFVTVESIMEVKGRLRRTNSPTNNIYKIRNKDDQNTKNEDKFKRTNPLIKYNPPKQHPELESTTITIPISKNNNVIDLPWRDTSTSFFDNETSTVKRHSIAVDASRYLSGAGDPDEDDARRGPKRVEFCKTEVHFTADSGVVNIIATDDKPPPARNFRRRRRNSGLPLIHFGDTPYDKLPPPPDDADPPSSSDRPPPSVTVNSGEFSYSEEEKREESSDGEIKGILKNKPPKPTPYLLGGQLAEPKEPIQWRSRMGGDGEELNGKGAEQDRWCGRMGGDGEEFSARGVETSEWRSGEEFSDKGEEEITKWGVTLRRVDTPVWRSTVTVKNFEFGDPEVKQVEPEFQNVLKNLRPVGRGYSTKIRLSAGETIVVDDRNFRKNDYEDTGVPENRNSPSDSRPLVHKRLVVRIGKDERKATLVRPQPARFKSTSLVLDALTNKMATPTDFLEASKAPNSTSPNSCEELESSHYQENIYEEIGALNEVSNSRGLEDGLYERLNVLNVLPSLSTNIAGLQSFNSTPKATEEVESLNGLLDVHEEFHKELQASSKVTKESEMLSNSTSRVTSKVASRRLMNTISKVSGDLNALRELYEEALSDGDADKEVQNLLAKKWEAGQPQEQDNSSVPSGSWSRLRRFGEASRSRRAGKIEKGMVLRQPKPSEMAYFGVAALPSRISQEPQYENVRRQPHQTDPKSSKQPQATPISPRLQSSRRLCYSSTPKKPVPIPPKTAPITPKHPIPEAKIKQSRTDERRRRVESSQMRINQSETSRKQINQSEKSQAEPNRSETGRMQINRAETNRSEKSRAETSQMRISHSETNRSESSVKSRAEKQKAENGRSKGGGASRARRLQRASSREALLKAQTGGNGSSSEDLQQEGAERARKVRKPRTIKKAETVQVKMSLGLGPELKRKEEKKGTKSEGRILNSLPEIRHKTAVSTIRSTSEKTARDRAKQKSEENARKKAQQKKKDINKACCDSVKCK